MEYSIPYFSIKLKFGFFILSKIKWKSSYFVLSFRAYVFIKDIINLYPKLAD